VSRPEPFAATLLLVGMSAGHATFAQKPGGILRMYSIDSPPTMSIHEEATPSAEAPMMGVFNNLIMFDQHVKQDSVASIVPDLATGWNWSEDGTAVTFPLRQGVKWHDGKPFTAADVECTWDPPCCTDQPGGRSDRGASRSYGMRT
jgi:peptide/nickel transport system substrate-binding protein